jgi:hypothetical protein
MKAVYFTRIVVTSVEQQFFVYQDCIDKCRKTDFVYQDCKV